MRKEKIMPSVVLGIICIVVAALLAVVNIFTGPVIDQMNKDKANAALLEVYPGGSGFTEVDLTKYKLPESITAVYSEASGGYVIQSTVTGYKPGLVIMCGIDKDGKIVGADYILSNETLSAEVGLGDRFIGKGEDEMSPDIVAGSTAKLTTSAYYNAILDAFDAFTVLNGGTATVRDPEAILQNNCNAALGTEDKTFERWFKTEEIVGVDNIYVSDSGCVAVIGESFIGIDSDGNAMGDVEDAVKANIKAAYDIYKSAKVTNLPVLPENVDKKVVKVSTTESGNYVIELKAAGYGIHGEWGSSGEYISLRVSISKSGSIIDCLTLYQSESEGVGDICADPDYYGQFVGKDALTYDSVENVSGATITTRGYKQAIKLAFDTLELLKGGN